MDHFLSSGFGCFGTSPFLLASAAGLPGAGVGGLTCFAACCFGVGVGSLAAIFRVDLAAPAGFVAAVWDLAVGDPFAAGAAPFPGTCPALAAGSATASAAPGFPAA